MEDLNGGVGGVEIVLVKLKEGFGDGLVLLMKVDCDVFFENVLVDLIMIWFDGFESFLMFELMMVFF